MKLTLQRKLRAICIPTALSFILTVPLLVSCSDNGNAEETTALLVSDDTTETPTDTYLEQEESITNGKHTVIGQQRQRRQRHHGKQRF